MKEICEILEDVSLKNYNTYRIDTKTKYIALPREVEELRELLEYLNKEKIKYIILGNGSNVIIGDSVYDGVIIVLTKINGIKIDNNVMVAECGAMLPKMCNVATTNGLKGLEWASGIPGTLGGSVVGNAGAYLSCIFDYLIDVTVLKNGKIETIKKEDIKYGYRYTEFKDNKDIIILKARLKLEKGSVQESLELIQDRRERRLKSQPLNYPSAGSVFRNPSKESPAGKLIEEASLKGYRIGGAEVSKLHANFIINVDNAKACDIKELIKVIKDKVKEKDNIDLICEQEILEWK